MKIATERQIENPDDLLQFEGMVNSIIAGYCKSGIPRDELLSEAWLGAIRALQTYDKTKGMKLSSWVFLNIKYSLKTAISMGKRYSERVLLGSDNIVLNPEASRRLSYYSFNSSKEDSDAMDAELVYRAISTLSERKKTILVRVYLGGETQQKVADALGISQSWCSRILKNVLAELRDNVRRKAENYEISSR